MSETVATSDPFWAWAVFDHVVVMLKEGATTYLYETSFGGGSPVSLSGFPLPSDGQVDDYDESHVFMAQYIRGGISSHAVGFIRLSRFGWDAKEEAFVPVQDIHAGKPRKFGVIWNVPSVGP